MTPKAVGYTVRCRHAKIGLIRQISLGESSHVPTEANWVSVRSNPSPASENEASFDGIPSDMISAANLVCPYSGILFHPGATTGFSSLQPVDPPVVNPIILQRLEHNVL